MDQNNLNLLNKEITKLPQIEKFSSRKEWKDACWHKLSQSEHLLDFLLTDHEKKAIAERGFALRGLLAGWSCRKTSKESQLSLQTVSCIKKGLKNAGYKSYINEKKLKAASEPRVPYREKKRSLKTKYGILHFPII